MNSVSELSIDKFVLFPILDRWIPLSDRKSSPVASLNKLSDTVIDTGSPIAEKIAVR